MATTSDYSTGKIYRLRNTVDEKTYIGSTRQTLQERMHKHKHQATARPTQKVYAHLNTIGWQNVSIELIENYPCENKAELCEREHHWCRTAKPELNSCLTMTEEDLKQAHRDNNRKWARAHPEEVKAQHKAWEAKNREAINAKSKQYVREHKDQRKSTCKRYFQKKPVVACGCGGQAKDPHRHSRTKKHLAWAAAQAVPAVPIPVAILE